MLEYFLYTAPTFGLILLSAIFGTIYLRNGSRPPAMGLFVAFLWFTVLVELVGSYPSIRRFTNEEWFGFTLNTRFERNYWLYNIYAIISFFVYVYFFIRQLKTATSRKVISVILGIFLLAAIINGFLSGVFFNGFLAFTDIAGSLVLLITISVYYYQLLNSDAILLINKAITFYISLGAILLHIALTPLIIYSVFFNKDIESDYFLALFRIMFFIINVLVYLIYVVGFHLCRSKRSY